MSQNFSQRTSGHLRRLPGPEFAGELFGKDQPLDATKFFIALPDGIGHGKSSNPSDSIHAKFPRYGYLGMVGKRSIGCLPGGSALITRTS